MSILKVFTSNFWKFDFIIAFFLIFAFVEKSLFNNFFPSCGGEYEDKFPGDSRRWKIQTFLNLQKKLDIKLAQMCNHSRTIKRKRIYDNNRERYFFGDDKRLLTLFTDLDIPEGVTEIGP